MKLKFFKNFLLTIKILLPIRKFYRPFFSSYKNKFERMERIDEDYEMPTSVSDVYDILLEISNKRFREDIKNYQNLNTNIKKHNLTLDKLSKVISSFPYEEIYDAPINYDLNEIIKEYESSVVNIKKYKDIDESAKEFIKNYNHLVTNFNGIYEQYLLKAKIQKLLTFAPEDYIDSYRKKEILDELNKDIETIKQYKTLFYDFNFVYDGEKSIDGHNNDFVNNHLTDTFFDNINGLSLDEDQREAILREDVSNLVVAGAGSGKTLTICGKIKYLIDVVKVDPKDILLLSYSKKSSEDLALKVHKINPSLTVNTFHKLGLDILKDKENLSLAVEDQFDAIIENYFRKDMYNNENATRDIFNYYTLFSTHQTYDQTYQTKGDLFENLKKCDLTTLKDELALLSKDGDNLITIKKEKVKSTEELAIANFYFINGIEYIYEAPYKFNTSTKLRRQYTPDFYLPEYDIYHEHYGIDENNRAKQFSKEDEEEYIRGIAWKREIHHVFRTKCLETYSYEMRKGELFDNLAVKLRENGVKFNPLTKKEVEHALKSIYKTRNFSSLIVLIKSFLSLYKAKYRTDKGFEELTNSINVSRYERLRCNLFLRICKHVYNYYYDYIRSENKIDFDDMILLSKDALKDLDGYKYKYIVVDEFQDISQSRMFLLKELISHGGSRIFAVGDDWQSIYRFAGSDIDIFTNFEKYFGPATITTIHATHRNSQQLQDIATDFIMENDEQFKKLIVAKKFLKNPIQIMYYSDNNSIAFISILERIYQMNNNASILVLGRNNNDLKSISSSTITSTQINEDDNTKVLFSEDFPTLNIKYTTVHGSKGLEEDFVILINAVDGTTGFPNKIEDDLVLNLVLSGKSNYPFAEERRLWYVALTRTKSYTYILCDINNPSVFVEEIKDDCLVINEDLEAKEYKIQYKCPRCGGHLVLRKNPKNNKTFWGCENYPYCDYVINDTYKVEFDKRCPRCGDYLIKKNGIFGPFYSCNSYPECKFSKNIKK